MITKRKLGTKNGELRTQNSRQGLRNEVLLFVLSSLFLVLSSQFLFADAPGTTTAELLKIPIGARAIGMGEAYTAMADDASALEWNPAGMSLLQQKEATFMHSSLIENINYEHAAFVAPGESYSYGASMSYLGYGSIAGYDNTGASIGNESADSYIFTGGISRMIASSFSVGATVSGIRETLADTSAGTFAANLGALYSLPFHPLKGNYRLGMSALNLGPGLKFIDERDPLPQRFQFGAAAMNVNEWPVNFTMDVTKPNDNSTYLSLGSEYWYRELIALRLGYTGENTTGNGFRMGVGLKLRQILFDYAYGSLGDFGAEHRIQLSLRFGDRIKQLNNEERAILKEANAAKQQGDYVQAIMDMSDILQKDPDNDHILREMIATNDAMVKGENSQTAKTSQEPIPSPEESALQDLVPDQQSIARSGFDPNDPLNLNKLPDPTNLDLSPEAAPAATPQVAAPAAAPSSPVAKPAASSADSGDGVMLNPSDIYGK